MNAGQLPETSEEKIKMFRWLPKLRKWLPKSRKVRDPNEVGSIRLIWKNEYPDRKRREELNIGGPEHGCITLLEKIFMTLLLVRTYIDWGYLLRKYIINNKNCESQFIEFYVLARLLLLLIALCLPMPFWLGYLVGWEIIGSLFFPLRTVFVDRYSKKWAPYSYHRSLIFLFLNYCEMVIGFAYMYLHFGLVGHSGCTNPISTVWEALYFSVVTITTLGYGDIRPISRLGRIFASIEPLMGMVLLVLVVGLLFVSLGQTKKDCSGNQTIVEQN